MVTKYYVFPSRLSEVHEGLIWVKQKNISHRITVRVKNPVNGRAFYCEVLPIDKTDGEYYVKTKGKDLAIFMNGWYRKKLGGIPTKQLVCLDLKTSRNPLWAMRTARDHPQLIIKVTYYFALASILLSLLGIGLNLYQWTHRSMN